MVYIAKTIDGYSQKMFIERDKKEYDVFNYEVWDINKEGYITRTQKAKSDRKILDEIENSVIWKRV